MWMLVINIFYLKTKNKDRISLIHSDYASKRFGLISANDCLHGVQPTWGHRHFSLNIQIIHQFIFFSFIQNRNRPNRNIPIHSLVRKIWRDDRLAPINIPLQLSRRKWLILEMTVRKGNDLITKRELFSKLGICDVGVGYIWRFRRNKIGSLRALVGYI